MYISSLYQFASHHNLFWSIVSKNHGTLFVVYTAQLIYKIVHFYPQKYFCNIFCWKYFGNRNSMVFCFSRNILKRGIVILYLNSYLYMNNCEFFTQCLPLCCFIFCRKYFATRNCIFSIPGNIYRYKLWILYEMPPFFAKFFNRGWVCESQSCFDFA